MSTGGTYGVSPARERALETFQEMRRGRRLDRAFGERARSLVPTDRAFAHELVFGVARLRGRIDYLLSLHVHRGLRSIDPGLLDLLRMGAYQLMAMGGVPSYAAVSQTVDQAKAHYGDGKARFVNGVLRSLTREGWDMERFPALAADPEGHLVSWGSHPQWLVSRWLDRWEPGAVAALVDANNRIPPLYLRPVGIGVDTLRAELIALGHEVAAGPEGSGVLRVLSGGSRIGELLGEVPAVVQDPGAAMVVAYTQPGEDWVVADLCAAPGGKALTLASQVRSLLAADRSAARLRILRANAERLARQLSARELPPLRIELVHAEAQHPCVSSVDLILLDVPCSGTGTLRRHPDARWRIEPETPASLARLQMEMLEASADRVSIGGFLVYSTCTLEVEENHGVIDAFLRAHAEFRIVPPNSGVDPGCLDESGCLMILPQNTGTDGAFAARLQRIA